MLRITVNSEAQATRLIIEGKLEGPYVEELRKCWLQITASKPHRPVLVNLTDMTGIGSEDKEQLAQMHLQGARLIGSGLVIESLIREIAGT